MHAESYADIDAQARVARELKQRRNRRFSMIAGKKIKRLHHIGRGAKNWWCDKADKSLSHKRRLARIYGVDNRLLVHDLLEYFTR